MGNFVYPHQGCSFINLSAIASNNLIFLIFIQKQIPSEIDTRRLSLGFKRFYRLFFPLPGIQLVLVAQLLNLISVCSLSQSVLLQYTLVKCLLLKILITFSCLYCLQYALNLRLHFYVYPCTNVNLNLIYNLPVLSFYRRTINTYHK